MVSKGNKQKKNMESKHTFYAKVTKLHVTLAYSLLLPCNYAFKQKQL